MLTGYVRQRLKCSSAKQSLFMSKEHLFLGKNGLFVSGKRDVFLQWWCFCLPLSWEAEIWPLCVFVTDTWGWLCSGAVNGISRSKGLLHKPWGQDCVNTHPSDLVFVGRSWKMYSKLFGAVFSGKEDGQGFFS